MTLVELIMGLAITTMVVGALAGFSVAVSSAWKQQETGTALQMGSSQAMARIQQIVREAKFVGYVSQGSLDPSNAPPLTASAALIFWKSDDGDGLIQLGELALLEHDSGEIKLYEAPATNVLAGAQLLLAILPIPSIDLLGINSITDLKSWAIFQDAKTIAAHVTGAEFAVAPGNASERPTFKFTLKFDRDGESTLRTATASLRSSLTAGN